MFFSRKQRLLEELDNALSVALESLESTIDWMRIDAAAIRHALKNNVDNDLTIPNDNLRYELSRQMAAILIARENLRVARNRRDTFNIKPIYVPLELNNIDDFVRQVWLRIWPDAAYNDPTKSPD